MKNIKFLFLLVATLFATAFTACQQEWEPGQPDSELCVYFPVDVNVAPYASVDSDETVELDETTTALFPVYRQTKGAKMTVEIRSRFVNPTALVSTGVTVAEAFTVAESVTFEEGSNVAYLQIERTEGVGLTIGRLYEIEVMIKDVKHQGNYGLSRKTFGVGIPETWRDLGDDYEDQDLKLGTYTEDFFANLLYGADAGVTVPITIEESEAIKGRYRMKNVFSQDNVVVMLGGIPSDMQFASGDTYIIIDARNPEKVYIPYQYSGIGIQGFMDQVYIASGSAIGKADGKLVDGTITFDSQTVGILDATGSGYLTNKSGMMRITLPGKSIKDYTFSVAHSGTETSVDNSETRAYFDFTVGADVSKYRFVIVDGNTAPFEKIKEGTGLEQTIRTEAHAALKAMLETNYVDGAADLSAIEDEAIKAYLENSAESSASSTTWYISMPEAGLYTMFAVPYNEKGEVILDDDGNAKVSTVLFYYNPANQDKVNVETTIKSMNLKLGSVAEVMSKPDYEATYPSCFVLAFDIQSDEADLVTSLTWYYSKNADIPEGIDASTEDGMKALIAMAGDDSDLSSQISSLKAGGSPMLIQATPDTEYTVVLAVSTIYGKTQYYSISAKTTPYYFDWAFGTYEFQDGESKMTIEFEPFFNSSYGLMFYMKWIVEDNAPDVKVREYPMVAFVEPEWNAVVCYGQVNGYKGTFFSYDYGYYGDDTSKVWGFESSSTPNYDYNYDSMVLYDTNEDGIIDNLGTYFRQYVKSYVEDKDGNTKVVTDYIKTFVPESTTITLVENKKPVVTEPEQPEQGEQGEQGENTPADEEQNAQPQAAKMGVSRVSKPAMLQIKKDVYFETVSIK